MLNVPHFLLRRWEAFFLLCRLSCGRGLDPPRLRFIRLWGYAPSRAPPRCSSKPCRRSQIFHTSGGEGGSVQCGGSVRPTASGIELRGALKLFIQATLFSTDFFRHHDFQPHVFIAATAASLVKTLASQSKPLSALRARRNG